MDENNLEVTDMTMNEAYSIVCDWLLQLKTDEKQNLSEKELERIEWHRKRMEAALDFVIKNPEDELASLHKSDFAVSFREIRKKLNK